MVQPFQFFKWQHNEVTLFFIHCNGLNPASACVTGRAHTSSFIIMIRGQEEKIIEWSAFQHQSECETRHQYESLHNAWIRVPQLQYPINLSNQAQSTLEMIHPLTLWTTESSWYCTIQERSQHRQQIQQIQHARPTSKLHNLNLNHTVNKKREINYSTAIQWWFEHQYFEIQRNFLQEIMFIKSWSHAPDELR